MRTEMELTLEQTQQGVSYEVSNIRVISITMKMEILLEPTSNKLMVDPYGFEGIFKDGDGENGVIRTKKYAKLTAAEKIQADCDMKATNIILQGLPADIYSLVNHHRVAKDLWERVQLLMQGTSLTKQERDCKLYAAFDKFTHIKGESLHTYYLRFTQLINDMNIYKMKMEQFQVNTKFLNSLPPEWSKFVTDVKLVKDLHTSNFDQLHAYLEQHELHANEVRIMRERNQDPLAFVANQQMTPPHFNPYQSSYNNPQLQQQFSPSQHASIQPNQHYSSHYPSQAQFNHSSIPPSHTFQSQMNHQTSTVPQVIPQVAYQSPQAPTQLMTESPFVDSGFVVLLFSPRDDPIACLNKAMAFLTAIASSRFSTTNNQLRTSSNLRNQATIQDGRVTVQQVQGRQGQNYSGTTYKGNDTSSRGNTTSGQARVVKCYNCQGEGHMARQCTQPKQPRNAAWYKEKAMLAEAQEAGQILDEEQLAFLADPGSWTILYSGTVRFGNDQIARIMGQFCDADLEVAFWKNTCFIRNLEGVDLLSGSRDTNLYTISRDDMLKSSPICLLSKASKTKSWLWHHRLSHLNFSTLNKLAKDGLARGIPRLKFQKDHLCSACALGKSKKTSHQPKSEDTSMRLKKFYKKTGRKLQFNAKEPVGFDKTKTGHVEDEQENFALIAGVVERRNRTLVEAARTMLIFSKAPLFLWAEAINTACYTQNRDLGKFDAKVDIGIFVAYAPAKKAFRIYNRRTRILTETIHVTFDELTIMASEQFSSGPGLHGMTPATSSTGLGSNPVSQQPCIPPIRDDWDRLFQPMFDEYFNPPPIAVSPVQELLVTTVA
ncbi:integrase, catalytic region, zinc finger, CCHC-type containing protein [Tanacetum coccineum]